MIYTFHYSSMELANRGYKMVASYECFKKGEKKLNINCYTDGKTYIVRWFYSRGMAKDFVTKDKNEANSQVKDLWSWYSFHRRVK